MRNFFRIFVIAAAFAPSIALAAPHVVLTNEAAFVEQSSMSDKTVLIPTTKSAPIGARIRYTITAHNEGDRPAVNLVPRAVVPASEEFVHAVPATTAEYSLDGGKTWSRTPIVHVKSGAVETTRPARPAEYTAVRWTTLTPLAPGARATFTYDVIVR